MRYWSLDFLRCLHCKNYPLELIPLEIEQQDIDASGLTFPICRNYCGYLKEEIKQDKEYPCAECLRIAVKTGILYCSKCQRWYPIRNGIVYMLRDSKRREESDKEFLRKYREKIPETILRSGKPFNLAEELQ